MILFARKILLAFVFAVLAATVAGFFSFFARRAEAASFDPLYRGLRETLLGGAYTAVADDEEAVYLNPAGLAGVKSPAFYFLDSMTEMSGSVITQYQTDQSALKTFNTNSLNALIGTNIYGREQFTPTFVMPNFGISFLIDGQAALNLQNQAFPQINLGWQTTNGVQLAYGTTVYKKGKDDNSSELRIGVGAKYLFRRGGYTDLSITQALDDGKDILSDVSGAYQHDIGFDLGTQYLRRIKNLTLMAGSAYTEVGDMNFGGQAAPQQGDLSLGVAAKYQLKSAMSLLVAYDYKYINLDADFRRKQHLGMELALPIIKLYAGLNEMYFTYGAAIDLWLIRITACTYTEELGDIEGQEPDKRYMLGLQLKLAL